MQFRDFFDSHSDKDPKFDEFGRSWISQGEFGQSVVEVQQLVIERNFKPVAVAEIEALQLPTPTQALFTASALDENPPHRLSRGSKEMAAAVPVLNLLPVDQTQVGIVYKGRGLESLARLLMSELLRRQLPQFGVDKRQQLLGRGWIASFDRGKNASDLAHDQQT